MNRFCNTRLYALCALCVLAAIITSCKQAASPDATLAFNSVIPKPVTALADGGAFFLTAETVIVADATEEVTHVAHYLAARLKPATGYPLNIVSEQPESNFIALTLQGADAALGGEGYTLTATSKGVTIAANQAAGLFYGVQTLCQLLPPAIESNAIQTEQWEIATGTISDKPTYAWRGSMLDVARHFFGVDDVKRYIDLISAYKMNTLHLHLSDDQGWRIEIKSWPNLTTIGGSTQVGGGPGGFYTQEQYKDLVQYAQERFITIVPEIDLPGHINAALASYGELNGGTIVPEEGRVKRAPDTQGVLGGKNKPTELYTGIEVGWSTLRVEKPVTFQFVTDVLKELAAITPGPYLHIGGDEAHVTKKEDYIIFISRFSEIVKGLNKKMIGWEEIAQSTIDANAIAQHWHSADHAKTAADKGASLILSPSTRVYLDMKYDSLTELGLNWAAYIEVDDAYTWDPAAQLEGVEPAQILGVEAPLWSETIANMKEIEYLLFPRLPGIAEVGWTPVAQRNWDEYKVRLGQHAPRFKAKEINYYKSGLVPWVE
ncbi:MAG: beta-N-acetylhexosaminidase [Bacteroidota bacterium]